MRPDPRIRQTINQITQNLESANETAQEGLYAFAHNYISPCLSSVGNCVSACTSPCLPRFSRREDQLRRRRRGRSRGRAELNFDFYDDWDYDYDYDDDVRADTGAGGLLGWGHDELERLLAGSSSSDPSRRKRRMSYGARRKGSMLPPDERADPTVIPSSSFLGFLERFPWRIGARGVRYRPSGADLQENPGGARRNTARETEPLLEGGDKSDESDAKAGKVGHAKDPSNTPGGRQRSATTASRETNTSLSSRGDLFPSDDEEDAVPLDDEFAMALEPRFATAGDDDFRIIRRTTSGTSAKETISSRDSKSTSKSKGKRPRASTRVRTPRSPASDGDLVEPLDTPTVEDLKREEERVRIEEEAEVERKRLAAQKLARQRGLEERPAEQTEDACDHPKSPVKEDTPANNPIPEPAEPQPELEPSSRRPDDQRPDS
ncbi:hypothetical protein VTO42DRAFT_4901 [Malbranchea cinnamomea]